jgi:hypothetical protein
MERLYCEEHGWDFPNSLACTLCVLKREQRRYEIARDVMAQLCRNELPRLVNSTGDFENITPVAVRAADALLAALEQQ